ncbi:MAG: hypothetical protein AVDCRST_MAG35-2270, partial [uncultured Quadrisphaera sp.]
GHPGVRPRPDHQRPVDHPRVVRAGTHGGHHHHRCAHRAAAPHRDLLLPRAGPLVPLQHPRPPLLVREPAGRPGLHLPPQARRARRPGRDGAARARPGGAPADFHRDRRGPQPAVQPGMDHPADPRGRLDRRQPADGDPLRPPAAVGRPARPTGSAL